MFADGGAETTLTLLVTGERQDKTSRLAVLLRFHHLQSICGYSETVYWSQAETERRPTHLLNRIEASPLLHQLKTFRNDPGLTHFLVCGGNMCCEIIAAEAYDILSLTDKAAALEALRG